MIGSNALLLVMLGSLLLLLLFASVWGVLLVADIRQRQFLFDRQGIVTTGKVLYRQVQYTKGRPHYAVVYQFTAETPTGQVVMMQAQEAVTAAVYERLTVGASVSVAYVPDNPAVARLDSVGYGA